MSQQIKTEGNVFPLPVIHIESDPFLTYSNNLRNSKTPIVIDNGSYQCKAGWANESKPSLVFKNHVARHRGRKENETQVGNDIKNIEVIRWLLKTQFDRNVVTQFDVQEIVLDYIFSHLGIDTEGCVEHPVVMTEALCNPSYSRQLMSELLFECYLVPQVAYGIDSLFSYYCNKGFHQNENALIISCGANTTHVIPMLGGRIDVQNCKRINIGGSHMTGFLHRLLQLKYPAHMSAISLSRAECLLHKHCHFSTSYQEDIVKWSNDIYYARDVHKIQLPFTPLPSAVSDTGVGKLEKCEAILHQVQALKIKRRAEKLALDEERLQELLSVQELLDDDDDEAILALQELGYSSPHELQAGIKQLNCSIRKTKNTIANQHVDEIQDSPLKNWCEELDPCNFSDMELWVSALRQKRKELQDKRVKVSLERMKDKGHSGFGSSIIPDLSGGIMGFQEDMQNFNDFMFELEERKERIEILDEILAEYNREFANSEHSFSFSLADYYQLHIGVERIRVPEILFQPSLIGNEQAGLAETLEMVFAQYSHEKQEDLLAQNVFLTGGCASIMNFKERIETELLCMRPFQSLFNLYVADDPVFDSWKGAKLWAVNGENMIRHSISRSDYEEKGADFFKEHNCSNYYVPPPIKKGIFGSDISSVIKTETKAT